MGAHQGWTSAAAAFLKITETRLDLVESPHPHLDVFPQPLFLPCGNKTAPVLGLGFSITLYRKLSLDEGGLPF